MKISLTTIGLLYILIIGGICHLIPFSEIIKAFLALPAFLMVPYFIGNIIYLLIKKILNIKLSLSMISKLIIFWLMGLISITIIALLLNAFNLFNFNIYVIIILVFIFFNQLTKNKSKDFDYKGINKYGGINTLLIVLLFGLLSAGFISHFSPYPLFYGSDMFRHNNEVLNIIEDNSIKFNIPYLPSFSLLVSIVVTLFNVYPNSFPIFWASRFITYPLFSIGVFLFVYQFSKSKKIALLSSLISSGILIEFVGLWNFTPKLIIYILFPFLLFLVYKELLNNKNINYESLCNKINIILFCFIGFLSFLLFILLNNTYKIFQSSIGFIIPFILLFILIFIRMNIINKNGDSKHPFLILMIISIASLFIHNSMGLMLLFVLLFFVFLSVFVRKFPKASNYLIYFLIFFILFYIILQSYNIISFPEVNIYKDAPNILAYDTLSKYNFLTNNNPNLFSYIFLIGFILLFLKRRYISIGIISLVMLIYFSKISGIERIITFLVPFISYVGGYCIIYIGKMFSNIFSKNKSYLLYIYCFLIIILLILSSTGQILNKMDSLISQSPPNNHYSHFNYNEYLIGEWTRNNTPKNTIIISDTYTDSMISGLSNRRKIELLLRSYYYPDKYPQKNEIVKFFNNNDSQESYLQIKDILENKEFTCPLYEVNPELCNEENDLNAIIIINKKTFSWLGKSYLETNFLDKFYNKRYFTPLYEDAKNFIYIYGVNQKIDIPFSKDQ